MAAVPDWFRRFVEDVHEYSQARQSADMAVTTAEYNHHAGRSNAAIERAWHKFTTQGQPREEG